MCIGLAMENRGAHRADKVRLVVFVGSCVGLPGIGRPVQAVVLADEDGVHII